MSRRRGLAAAHGNRALDRSCRIPRSRAASQIMSQPIGADFPEHFDIAATAVFLFEVCQKREDWQIRTVSEHLFECFSGFSLWFIHCSLRYSRGSADIGWTSRLLV